MINGMYRKFIFVFLYDLALSSYLNDSTWFCIIIIILNLKAIISISHNIISVFTIFHETQLSKFYLRKGDLKMSLKRDFLIYKAWKITESLEFEEKRNLAEYVEVTKVLLYRLQNSVPTNKYSILLLKIIFPITFWFSESNSF